MRMRRAPAPPSRGGGGPAPWGWGGEGGGGGGGPGVFPGGPGRVPLSHTPLSAPPLPGGPRRRLLLPPLSHTSAAAHGRLAATGEEGDEGAATSRPVPRRPSAAAPAMAADPHRNSRRLMPWLMAVLLRRDAGPNGPGHPVS